MTVVNDRLHSHEAHASTVGEVNILRSEQVVDRKRREYTRQEVHVGDESDKDPSLKEHYRYMGNQFEQMLRWHGRAEWPSTTIVDGTAHVSPKNLAARWLYYDRDGAPTQMLEWAGQFPKALALEPLQLLSDGGKWLSAGKLDDRTLELFTYMPDGIGLRSRARIYTDRLIRHAEETKAETLSIVSLGCGAAVPNVQATRRLETAGVGTHWRFYDWDASALQFAQGLVENESFEYATFDYGPTWENPKTGKVEPRGQNYLRAFGLENESVDIVDALGLWEYLKPEEATRFAAKLFTKVKPGGKMIVSNMVPSRPQREFNQRAVGWPGLYLRGDSDLLDIIEAAGIDSRQVTLTHSEDGVYVVMEVRKV